MKALGLVGLFFVWCLILILAGITWVTWAIQKVIITIIMFLGDKFFPESKHDLRKFL